jgi:Leucine-rich repeat (LRR) protein
LECEYGYDSDNNHRCKVERADLTRDTVYHSFTFLGSLEEKQITNWITFTGIGRVDHLPLSMIEEFPNFKILSMKESEILILKNNFFKPEFSKLQVLGLSQNKIKIIEENAFEYLTNLYRIFLGGNEIKYLPEKLFQNNPNLEWIDLEYNKIKMINPGTFKILNQMRIVFLWQNDCTNDTTGCTDCDEKVNKTELDVKLQSCYENYETKLGLLNGGENKKIPRKKVFL